MLGTMRNRPLCIFGISIIAGIISASILPIIYGLAVSIILFFLFMIIVRLDINKIDSVRNQRIKRVDRYILFFVLVFFYIGMFEYYYFEIKDTNFLKNYYGKMVRIEGYIDSEPIEKDKTICYEVKVKKTYFDNYNSYTGGKVMLYVLKDSDNVILEYGSLVSFDGILKLPDKVRNPYGFNSFLHYKQLGIAATIFTSSTNIAVTDIKNNNILISFGMNLRNSVINIIKKSLQSEQAAILNAMLIGYKKDLSKEMLNYFRDSGIIHIMVVSGSNIGMILLPAFFIFRRLKLNNNIASWIMILLVAIYTLMAGFEPSIIRAAIMAVIIIFSRIILRPHDIYTSLAFSAIIMLLINPYTLFNISFQLSFFATLSIIFFYKEIIKRIEKIKIHDFFKEAFATTAATFIGVTPILVFYFNRISFSALLSNIIVVPVAAVVVNLGMMVALSGMVSIFISKAIGIFLGVLINIISSTAVVCASLPYTSFIVITPSIIFMILYYLFIVYIFKIRYYYKIQKQFIFAGFSLLLLIYIFYNIIPGKLEVVFLDVGSGDSIYIRTPERHNIVIDGGGSKNFDTGEMIVVPFLMDYGVSKLDAVIATHSHEDHIKGLVQVLKTYQVNNLIIPYTEDMAKYGELINVAINKKIKIVKCLKGDILNFGKTRIYVMHPCSEFFKSNEDENDSSLVLELKYINNTILFTGDAGKSVEEQMIKDKEIDKIDVLKVAHHGSNTASNYEFLKRIMPKAAVISVGENLYGHPSDEVLENLKNLNIKVYRTDQDGAVIVEGDGNKIRVKTVDDL